MDVCDQLRVKSKLHNDCKRQSLPFNQSIMESHCEYNVLQFNYTISQRKDSCGNNRMKFILHSPSIVTIYNQ